jgi:hypothetical protein
MSLLFAEGFDDFAVPADIALSAAAVGPNAAVLTGRQGNGKGISTTQTGATVWNVPAAATAICGFALITGGAAGANSTWYGQLALRNGSGTLVCCVQQYQAATIRLFSAAQNGDGSTGLLVAAPFSGWGSYIEIKVTPGNPGTVVMKVDGLVVFTGSANLASGTVSQIELSASVAGLTPSLDDLYFCDALGSANNDFLGDTRIQSFAPTGDGAHLDFTMHPGAASHFLNVNASPINYGSTFNAATAPAQIDTYTFPAFGGTFVVRAVQVRSYASTSVGGVDKAAGLARVAGSDHPAADQFVHATYAALDSIFETNPATGLAWLQSDVAAAEFGLKRTV